MGLRGLFRADPVDVYRQHANRLKMQGLSVLFFPSNL